MLQHNILISLLYASQVLIIIFFFKSIYKIWKMHVQMFYLTLNLFFFSFYFVDSKFFKISLNSLCVSNLGLNSYNGTGLFLHTILLRLHKNIMNYCVTLKEMITCWTLSPYVLTVKITANVLPWFIRIEN